MPVLVKAYEHAIPTDKRAEAINLDDTARQCFLQHPGLVVKRARRRDQPETAQQVSRTHQRSCMSLAAFVYNTAAVPPSQRQFLISNEHALGVGGAQQLQQQCSSSPRVLRRKSACADLPLCRRS